MQFSDQKRTPSESEGIKVLVEARKSSKYRLESNRAELKLAIQDFDKQQQSPSRSAASMYGNTTEDDSVTVEKTKRKSKESSLTQSPS